MPYLPVGTFALSRRHFIVSAGLAATAISVAPGRLLGGQESLVVVARRKGEMANITTQALRGNVTALIGSGGNIAVLTGAGGKLIVDSGYAGSREKIREALNAINHDPIKHLINTHWHFDHTDGNEWMHSAGAIVSAHNNTKKHLSASTRADDWDFTFPPSPAGAIPSDVFETEKTLQLDGGTIVLKYYGLSHTDGDVSAYFKEADVLHTGDTWWNGHVPFIDYSTGGNINGMVLKPTAAYDAKWAGSFIDGKFFTRLVYRGV
jgi:glyoxylase-like metal-dependent hydrolase (beta-lactamase superfamily II)